MSSNYFITFLFISLQSITGKFNFPVQLLFKLCQLRVSFQLLNICEKLANTKFSSWTFPNWPLICANELAHQSN